MTESKKFAFDVSITFIASMITMFFGFVITVLRGRYHGAGDFMALPDDLRPYRIAILAAAIGIPAAMIKWGKSIYEHKNS